MNNLMIIHRNTEINQPIYQIDRDGGALPIAHTGSYRCTLRKRKGDDAPVLTFQTGGGSGVGTLSVIYDEVDDEVRDLFLLEAEQALAAVLDPGAYYGDIVRTDGTDDQPIGEFEAIVDPRNPNP
jgi:hypothetical protein